jgi:putative toxin-antitoxin system antitoxin component (TIGR02293 family)
MSVPTGSNDKYSVRNRFKNLNLNNSHTIVLSARKGLKPKIFYDFADAIKMPEKVLARIINLSARTITNYRAQQKVLDPVNSEHLLKLISLFEKGESIFGNVDEFNYWLRKPFWNSRETPIHWMNTHGGVDLLMEELDKLAKGYPV